jgi:hypothetical protein
MRMSLRFLAGAVWNTVRKPGQVFGYGYGPAFAAPGFSLGGRQILVGWAPGAAGALESVRGCCREPARDVCFD